MALEGPDRPGCRDRRRADLGREDVIEARASGREERLRRQEVQPCVRAGVANAREKDEEDERRGRREGTEAARRQRSQASTSSEKRSSRIRASFADRKARGMRERPAAPPEVRRRCSSTELFRYLVAWS